MKRIVLPILVLAILPFALCAAPTDKKASVLRKGSYRFEITTGSRVGEWFGWWGAPDTGRVDVLIEVRAFRGKQRLYLPPSAFAGLADAHDFSVRETKRGMELKIVGSDAGGAWNGTFLFDGSGIVQRTIRDGEFPDLSYERTTYRSIKPGEIN